MAAKLALTPDIGRQHLYASASITSTFVNLNNAGTLPSRPGTVFILQGAASELYMVTNRHMVDYNFNLKPSKVCPGAALESVLMRGHFQPARADQDTEAWSIEIHHPQFEIDDELDLAVLAGKSLIIEGANANTTAQHEGKSALYEWNRFAVGQLATTAELDSMLPGETIYQTGFPRKGGLTADRPLMVSGIISSDPRYPAVFADTVLPGSVLCHSFSWGGMSGAPVIAHSYAIGRSAVVGVNAGHIESNDVSGGVISHFVRSDRLFALLMRAGEPPPPSASEPARLTTE